MEKISIELWVSIGINLLTLAFFAGVFAATQKQLKENMKVFKEEFTKKIDDMKADFSDRIKDLKDNFHEKFDTLEKKQAKHNNLIERMALAEASTKSAHKRGDELSERVTELEEKYYEHIAKGN